jgi:hypothetical protein
VTVTPRSWSAVDPVYQAGNRHCCHHSTGGIPYRAENTRHTWLALGDALPNRVAIPRRGCARRRPSRRVATASAATQPAAARRLDHRAWRRLRGAVATCKTLNTHFDNARVTPQHLLQICRQGPLFVAPAWRRPVGRVRSSMASYMICFKATAFAGFAYQ